MGCAFAACLERKQRREKECGVTATFDASRTSFAREGSFRLSGGGRPAEREAPDKKKGGCCPGGRVGHRVGPGGARGPVYRESFRDTGTLQCTKRSTNRRVWLGSIKLTSVGVLWAIFCRPRIPAKLTKCWITCQLGEGPGFPNCVGKNEVENTRVTGGRWEWLG